MIHSLEYRAVFTSTGRVLEKTLHFDRGVTAITGPNESGKSFAIEMIRFGLFGNKALRSVAEDYASLSMSMQVTIRGNLYKITRGLNKATLTLNEEELAVGTRPVNDRIITILGFGIDVFDIACSVNQGEVERLSSMLPTERKRMIDKVIGADKLEALANWCGEQGTMSRRELDGLKRGLIEPVLPIPPDNYVSTEITSSKISELEALHRELSQIEGWLASLQPEPVAPVRPSELSIDDIEQELSSVQALTIERDRVQAIPVLSFDPEKEALHRAAYEAHQRALIFQRSNPSSEAPVDHWRALLALSDEQQHLTSLKTQRAQLEKAPSVVCPCGKTISVSEDALQKVINQIAASTAEGTEPVDLQAARRGLERALNWADPKTLSEWEEHKDHLTPVAVPTITRAELQQASQMLNPTVKAQQLQELENKLAALPQLGILRNQLRAIQEYEAALPVYSQKLSAYHDQERVREERVSRREILTAQIQELPALRKQYAEGLVYETQNQSYEAQFILYNQKQIEVAETELIAEGWAKAKVALNQLRAEIKTHLVPSLSSAASSILSLMTGGARQSIVVDENFEITVDGQKLVTLSGSGKACTNLALRIGLARVLTNNVLSLLIGDEIDASMDAERGENLQQVTVTLSEYVSQIILVTHKTATVSSVIEMGNGQGYST